MRAGVDIEDLAQETYLRLLRCQGSRRCAEPAGLPAESGIERGVRMAQSSAAAGNADALDESAFVHEIVAEVALEAEVSRRQLDEMLQDMPPMTRAVVLLKFRDGWRCKEIARHLQLTERQVRRHLTRAFEQLRETLKAEAPPNAG